MPDGSPDLFRRRWRTAPTTSSSYGTKSSTGNGYSATGMLLPGGGLYGTGPPYPSSSAQWSHVVERGGGVIWYRNTTLSSGSMPSLRGGDLTREGLLTPPMPSTRADSNPVSGLPTPSDPESGDGTGPSGAAVEMLLACQKSAKSPQRSTGYNDAPWEVFWVFTVLVWQTTNLPGLVVSEGIGGTSGTNLGSRNYPVVKRREYTQEP